MNHKQRAGLFLSLAVSDKIDEAFETYVSDDLIHHNQHFDGDRSSLMKAMQEYSDTNPSGLLEVKRVIEEGD